METDYLIKLDPVSNIHFNKRVGYGNVERDYTEQKNVPFRNIISENYLQHLRET